MAYRSIKFVEPDPMSDKSFVLTNAASKRFAGGHGNSSCLSEPTSTKIAGRGTAILSPPTFTVTTVSTAINEACVSRKSVRTFINFIIVLVRVFRETYYRQLPVAGGIVGGSASTISISSDKHFWQTFSTGNAAVIAAPISPPSAPPVRKLVLMTCLAVGYFSRAEAAPTCPQVRQRYIGFGFILSKKLSILPS